MPNLGDGTKLIDIPFELLLDTYKYFDINTLANVAKTHSYNRRAAEVVFNDKFANKLFEINGKVLKRKECQIGFNYTFEFNAMLNALEMFGHLMTTLRLQYDYFTAEQSECINKHVSKYTKDSLISIEIKSPFDEYLKGLTGPFGSAKIVHLQNGQIKSNNFAFNQIFPAVRFFDLSTMTSISTECIEHHFLHLEEMHIEYMLSTNSPALERRLRLNAQLKALTIFEVNWMSLRMISETVPRLERLNLLGFNDVSSFQGNDIRFEHMKVWNMKKVCFFPAHIERIPIVFGNLEEITFDRPVNKWFNIVMQNKNVKRIISGELNDEQLQQMAEDLPNLEAISTSYVAINGDAVDKIVRFLETSGMLQRATFSNMNVNVCSEIVAKLPNWTAVAERKHFIFVRN